MANEALRADMEALLEIVSDALKDGIGIARFHIHSYTFDNENTFISISVTMSMECGIYNTLSIVIRPQ